MKSEAFNDIVEKQIAQCRTTLVRKADEYATEDRLHNFKVAAQLQGITPEQALLGMWTKHVVSIADMIQDGRVYPAAQWDEKIGDAINYLILLKGLVVERLEE